MLKYELKTVKPDLKKVKCYSVKGIENIKANYSRYLTDESRFIGMIPEKIYFPKTTLEVSKALQEIIRAKGSVSISGARTGITGGAVPVSALNLISLEKLILTPDVYYDRMNDSWILKVGAGTRLFEIEEILKSRRYKSRGKPPDNLFYPVDPTETTASAGGMTSTNASGARTLYYGATDKWIAGIKFVLADGSILKIKRGEYALYDNKFQIKIFNKRTEFEIPVIKIPETKHVAGYYLKKGMDPIDLFIGSEGTLGIITEIEFKMCRMPDESLFLCVFLNEKKVIDLVRLISGSKMIKPFALEFIDESSIKLLNKYRKEVGESSHVPDFKSKKQCAVYLEIGFKDQKEFEAVYEELEQIFKRVDISAESTWAGFSQKDLSAMKKFRHALPERINSIIAERKKRIPGLTKVGTDMAVPLKNFKEMYDFYKGNLKAKRLEHYIFGHIGNGHVHVNIIPHNKKELDAARQLYKKFAEKAVALKGSIAAEHGIGRLKKYLMDIQFSREELKAMKEIKDKFDPYNILNPDIL
jgi:D-lactate dehydrogenase (cytochrome)